MRMLLSIGLAGFMLGYGIVAADARGGGGRGGYGGGLVAVRGHVTSRGTYVAPHYRTAPDGILTNNLSYRGIRIPAPDLGRVERTGALTLARAGEGVQPAKPLLPEQDGEPPTQTSRCPPPMKVAGSGAGFCMIN